MMRAFLWQQFSSNHSANFTVAGVFETVETAERAAQELTTILIRLAQWYVAHADQEEAQEASGEARSGLRPVERELSDEYGVPWNDQPLDWFWMPGPGRRAITKADRLVFVNSPDTWSGARPFDALVERLGGKALVDSSHTYEGDSAVHVDLSCLAPAIDIAQEIEQAVNHYLDTQKKVNEAWSNWQVEGLDYSAIFNTPWKDYTDGHVFERSTMTGTVHREEAALWFEGMSFFHLGHGLPAMMAYLKDNGCTDIVYTLKETRHRYEDPEAVDLEQDL